MRSVTISLEKADPHGSRVIVWNLDDGIEFYTTPKGELIVSNPTEKWETIFNPYAWQSYTVRGIEAEPADG